MTNNTNFKFLAIGLTLGAITTLTLAAACAPVEDEVHTEPTAPIELPMTDPADMAEPGDLIVLPPCAEEDSKDCYWDAETRGNGEGTSFIDYEGRYYIEVR